MAEKEMVEKFLCIGCTCGGPTTCQKYNIERLSYGGFHCSSHSAGTFFSSIGRIALGLPKGFNRYGGSVPPSHLKEGNSESARDKSPMLIRLFSKENKISWDKFNVPVWAMVKDGYLFVRTDCPRINLVYVDVVKGGTLEMVPSAIDVSKFYDEMD